MFETHLNLRRQLQLWRGGGREVCVLQREEIVDDDEFEGDAGERKGGGGVEAEMGVKANQVSRRILLRLSWGRETGKMWR